MNALIDWFLYCIIKWSCSSINVHSRYQRSLLCSYPIWSIYLNYMPKICGHTLLINGFEYFSCTQVLKNKQWVPRYFWPYSICHSEQDEGTVIKKLKSRTVIKKLQILLYSCRTLLPLLASKYNCNTLVVSLQGLFKQRLYVVLKGDARYLISNSKDQSIKLWDVRKFSPKEGLAASRLAVTQQNWDYRWQQVPQRGVLACLRNFNRPARQTDLFSTLILHINTKLLFSLVILLPCSTKEA